MAAKHAAMSIGTVHHGFEFTVQEGLDALRDVIWHIESFDTTTVRASTPMVLMARRIRATGVKMVLSGEGADEIFGGYLYFHKAPSARAFHEELVRKLQLLHLYDCLRANKSMAAWGSKPASRSSIRASSTSRCASPRGTRWSLPAASRRRSCARRSAARSPTRSCGGRRSNSPMASVTRGSTR